MNSTLLQKYNVPVPRYTSYPTVPHWNNPPDAATWLDVVRAQYDPQQPISVYIHLPFCEQLCTYCGCNKRITKNHAVERPYLEALLAEWQLYLDALPTRPRIQELHLGGGTPTFFSPAHLRELIEGILAGADWAEDHDGSVEVHPNMTTLAHIQALRDVGFNRLSIGVQDVSPHILKLINRDQTVEQIENLTHAARAMGYRSVNFDWVYGLPTQTLDNMRENMALTARLRPDRIALYSYAHVPWKSKSQRAYSEADLPTGATKRALYDYSKAALEAQGYQTIGMDHFALPDDALSLSANAKRLHRNFMGYTPYHTELMIGLGCSAISDAWGAFVQNEKHVETYQAAIAQGQIPIINGHLLTPEDQTHRQHITALMCNHRTTWEDATPPFDTENEALQAMINEGLVYLEPHKMEVTAAGIPFVRNICAAIDPYVQPIAQASQPLFSQAI